MLCGKKKRHKNGEKMEQKFHPKKYRRHLTYFPFHVVCGIGRREDEKGKKRKARERERTNSGNLFKIWGLASRHRRVVVGIRCCATFLLFPFSSDFLSFFSVVFVLFFVGVGPNIKRAKQRAKNSPAVKARHLVVLVVED